MKGEEIKETTQQLLQKGKIEEALHTLITTLENSGFPREHDNALLLKARWESVKQEQLKGIIARQEYETGLNSILVGIQSILNDIDEDTPFSHSPQQKKANNSLLLIIAVLGTLLVAAVGFYFFNNKKEPKKEEVGTINPSDVKFNDKTDPPAPIPSSTTQQSSPAPQQPAQPKTPTKGLMAYYPFNANANDESGNGNNGVVEGATLTKDRFNNAKSAYYFNGTSDYIKVNHSSSIAPNVFTISVWAYLSSPISNNYLRILSKHIDEGGSYGSYQILTGTIKDPFRCHGTAITTTAYNDSESASPTTEGWHHLVLTFNGNSLDFYLDNELVGEKPASGRIKYDMNPLLIGKDGFYQTSFFKGAIDDIRIYNRVLVAEEISGLFNESR